MRKTIIQPLAMLAVSALISAQAVAYGSHQRGIDWEEELDLTEQQEEQIEAIEDRYQNQLRSLRKHHGQRHEQQPKSAILVKQMRKEIQQVLTKEQRALARQLITERRQKAMAKRIKKLARKLDMTDKQKQQLEVALRTEKSKYQWPMDQEQRQQARERFDSAMVNILTKEQQQQWQAMKTKSKQRWHHNNPDNGQHGYYKNGYGQQESHGGLRKGYHDW